MGLDMYLYVEKYVPRLDYINTGSGITSRSNPAFEEIVNLVKAQDLLEPEGWSGMSVQVPVGYWRKFNAVHHYIVENHANGIDECQPIKLTRRDLQDLLDICESVFEHHKSSGGSTVMAETLLRTGSGFFFGSTDYDEWYYEGVKRTIDTLKRALNDKDDDYFTYQASW